MNECAVPASRSSEARWMQEHTRLIRECKKTKPEVLLIGDSIIQKLIYCDEVWSKLFSLRPLNLGICGDQTQHVRWRLSNGAVDHTHPKVVLLHIGTNNQGYSSQHIAEGILSIVNMLQILFPTANIVVWGLLPRGESPNIAWQRNDQVNEILQKNLEGKPLVEMICTGDRVIQTDDLISRKDLSDYLHFTSRGYVKVFSPVLDKLETILNSSTQCQRKSPIRNFMQKTLWRKREVT